MSGTNSGVSSGLQNISSGLGSLSSGLQNASAGSVGQDLSMTGGGANNYWTPQRMANATSAGAYDTGGGVLGAAANQAATGSAQSAAGSNQGVAGGNAGMGSMGLLGTPVYGNQVQQASAGGGQSSAGAGNVNNQRVYAAPINGNYVGGYKPWTAQRMQNAKTNLGNYG